VNFFTCRLAAKDALGRNLLKMYKVDALFEPSIGQYSCRLQLLTGFIELLSIVKTHDVYLELEVSLKQCKMFIKLNKLFSFEQAVVAKGVSDKMSLKLVPGIKVFPESVRVTDLKPHEIHISGLDKALLKVQVSRWWGFGLKSLLINSCGVLHTHILMSVVMGVYTRFVYKSERTSRSLKP